MKKSSLTFLSALSFLVSSGQDPHFSQFYNTMVYINPATVGDFQNEHRVSLHYRDQWRSATSPFKTTAFSYDFRLDLNDDNKDIMGLGVQVLQDKAGETGFSQTHALGTFSYRKRLGKRHFFSFGIQGGMRQHRINYEDGTWGSQFNGTKYDPSLQSGETFFNQSFLVADVNAGTQYSLIASRYFKARLGASIHHLTRPVVSFVGAGGKREEYRMNGHFAMDISSPNTKLAFVPSVLYMRQLEAQEIIGGVLARYALRNPRMYGNTDTHYAISLGGFYRNKDALVFVTQLDMGAYMIGFSFDTTVSRLSNGTRGVGGFEICLRYINIPLY